MGELARRDAVDFIRDHFVGLVLDGYVADGYGGKDGAHHCPADAAWYDAADPANNTWTFATASGRSLGRLAEKGPREALAEFRKLPAAERTPAVAPEPDPEKGIAHLRPPPDGLVVRVYGVPLARDGRGELGRAPRLYTDCYAGSAGAVEPALTQGDMLWLTAEEARSLVPPGAAKGESRRIPPVIERRILACTQPMCEWGIGERGELTLTVVDASPARVTMRLEGWSTKGEPFAGYEAAYERRDRKASAATPGFLRGIDGQHLRFLGTVVFDPGRRAVVAFDVVAVREAWGERVNRVHGAGAGAAPRRWPMGFALEVAPGSPADRITPPKWVQNAPYNGGYAERYWGR